MVGAFFDILTIRDTIDDTAYPLIDDDKNADVIIWLKIGYRSTNQFIFRRKRIMIKKSLNYDIVLTRMFLHLMIIIIIIIIINLLLRCAW